MEPKGALVLWKFKFCAKNHLVKVVTLNWCIKYTIYIHKGTVQRHLCLIEGVSLPLRGKQGVFSLKKFAYISLYMAKCNIKALWAIPAHFPCEKVQNNQHRPLLNTLEIFNAWMIFCFQTDNVTSDNRCSKNYCLNPKSTHSLLCKLELVRKICGK